MNVDDHLPHDIPSSTPTPAATEGALSKADTEPYQGLNKEAQRDADKGVDIIIGPRPPHLLIRAAGQVSGWAHFDCRLEMASTPTPILGLDFTINSQERNAYSEKAYSSGKTCTEYVGLLKSGSLNSFQMKKISKQ